MRGLNHDNVNQFHGLSQDITGNISVWKACTRGSLRDVFEKDSITLDWFFKFSLIRDIFEVKISHLCTVLFVMSSIMSFFKVPILFDFSASNNMQNSLSTARTHAFII
jgi:hypothetical protein